MNTPTHPDNQPKQTTMTTFQSFVRDVLTLALGITLADLILNLIKARK